MARMDAGNGSVRKTLQKFGGLDCRTSVETDGNARAMCNFRVLSDGSLQKREGFSTLCTLSGTVRGTWTGYLGGQDILLVAAGQKLFRVIENAQSGAVVTEQLISLTTSAGKVMFFYLEGYVFILDGVSTFSYDGSVIDYANCYAPLYGNNWDIASGGSIHEPINAFSKKIRVHFRSPDSASSVRVGMEMESVDAVLVDDNYWMAKSNFSLSEDKKSVNFVQTYVTTHTFMVFVRLSDNAMKDFSALTSCTGLALYGGEFDDRVFLYHGNNPADIYYSYHVSSTQLAQCRKVWPGQRDLYFSMENKMTVDNGQCEVTGLCRYYDRLLVFRHDGTSVASLAGNAAPAAVYPALPLNGSVGCVSPEGMCLYGNDPVTVSEKGIFRWLPTTEQRDECNAVCISQKVAGLLDAARCRALRCVSWYDRGEIWFYQPGDPDGTVLVCAPGRNTWYQFSGIVAERMFLFRNQMCFYHGNSIYRFSEAVSVDEMGDVVTPITATYQMAADGGDAWRKKRLRRCYLVCEGGGNVAITFKTDSGQVNSTSLSYAAESGVQTLGVRLPSGRFNHGILTLKATGNSRARLYGLSVACVKS